MKYIMSFDEIGKNDISEAGGKGANLGEMTRAGIPVPRGAVLTAAAYDSFIEHNGIDTDSATIQNAADIRSAVMNGELPPFIMRELAEYYRSLGENARVAVRSSATAEDLEDASFAGQQETYLNVRGEAELLAKVKECYASLWGDRAVSYRHAQGYDRQKVSLAVVIQQMIESDSAGVLFTKDPSGASEDIVINASYGLGEAVVSGVVSPDEYRCGRDGTVKKTVLGSKEVRIVYGENGTVRELVPEDLRAARVLDESMVKTLVFCALGIEKHYGKPMDIEWAFRDGELFILQARCITTVGRSGKSVETELSKLPRMKPAKGKTRESVLFNLEKMPKPYLPLDHDFSDSIGRQKQVLLAEAGVCMDDTIPIDRGGISYFTIGGFRPNRGIVHLPRFVRGLYDDKANIAAADKALAELQSRLDEENSRSYGSAGEVGKALKRMRKLLCDTAYARFRYAVFPQVAENVWLERKLKKLDEKLGSFDLMEGLSYVTADINRAMSEIAREIIAEPETLEAVMTLPYNELVRSFPELETVFGGFLKKYGRRSDFNCYCFTAKSWEDDPDRFLGTLRTLIRSGSEAVPDRAASMEKFRRLMHRMQRMLREKQYRRFKRKVIAVRHYHYIREATQYLWECEFACCRGLLRRCAELLGEDYGDLLYLFADELYEVCANGALIGDMRSRIERRRAKRPLAEAYWSRCIEDMLADGGSGITGVSGSAGSASGKVRIVRSPAEFDRLQKGEVLVCPYTDPEWTPLFTLAAAVVVDTGGTLSHAAIVAREYGIPAVLATGTATKRLHDGDSVIVDGTSGTVSVIK